MEHIAIIYASIHHGNTKKLLESIGKEVEVELLNVNEAKGKDFSSYQMIGFASGIYAGNLHKTLFSFLASADSLPLKSFIIYTSGSGGANSARRFSAALLKKDIQICGIFQCLGFDTFGPFKLMGGIGKGHPNAEDLSNATTFVKQVIKSEV